MDLFAWAPDNMPRIDPNMVCHHICINLWFKPFVHHKHKVGADKKWVILEEVMKRNEAGLIQDIKYPTWLANIVMVKNKS